MRLLPAARLRVPYRCGWAFSALGLAWIMMWRLLPAPVSVAWTLRVASLVMLAVAAHRLKATQRRKREVETRTAALRSLPDQMPLPVVVTDRELRVIRTNAGTQRLVGERARQAGVTCRELLRCPNPPDGACDDACGLVRALTAGETPGARRMWLHDADGGLQQAEAVAGPLRGPDGTVCGGVLVLRLRVVRAELEIERMRAAYLERVQHQMNLARNVQEKLMEPDSMTVRLGSRPLKAEVKGFSAPSMEVGGDFYRFVQTSAERACVVLGDVQGKGLAAALIMAMTLSLLQEALRRDWRPGRVLEHVNRHLSEALPSATTFVTALVLTIDATDGAYRMARAGHAPALLLRRRQCHEVPRRGGMPLGIERDESYPEETLPIQRGDLFLLYTDGLVEIGATDAPLLSLRDLQSLAENAPPGDAADLHARLSATLAGGHLPARDDVTFVTVGVTWEEA